MDRRTWPQAGRIRMTRRVPGCGSGHKTDLELLALIHGRRLLESLESLEGRFD